eukprot:58877-Chlamydomonas_euryale.AAC.1
MWRNPPAMPAVCSGDANGATCNDTVERVAVTRAAVHTLWTLLLVLPAASGGGRLCASVHANTPESCATLLWPATPACASSARPVGTSWRR